jgi:mannosyltransferase OCH1-like enzyme
MADMARVLITYHYGGTYMDLDFYCHKPLRCVIQQAEQQMLTALERHNVQGEEMSRTHLPKSVLIVSREPVAHAVVFRNKTRVVIQVQ